MSIPSSQLPLILILGVLFTIGPKSAAAEGILSDSIEKLRENAVSVKQVGNVDVVQVQQDDSGGAATTEYGLCHIPTILPFADGDLLPIVQVGVATHLAIEHLNSGNGVIIPEVEGLNERCPIRFTTEMIDSKRSPSVAVNEAIEIISRENQTTCAIAGAGRSPVTIPLAIISGIRDIPQISPLSTSEELNNKEIYPRFARTVPDSMGEATAIVKYFCNEVNTRHLVVPHEQQDYGITMSSSIVSAATEICPEMSIFPLSIPEDFNDLDVKNAATAIKNSEFKHVFYIGSQDSLQPLLERGVKEGIAGNSDYFWTAPWGAVKNMEAPEDSDLAMALAGFGSVTLEAGVAGQGESPYDRFKKAFASLANPTDLAFINSRQPYADSFIPPPTFNKIIRGSPFFQYDAIISIGLAACNSANDGIGFNGTTLYQNILESDFEGTTGKVKYIKESGSREPESAVYVMNNFLAAPPVNGTVKFMPTATNVFSNGEWRQMGPKFIYNGGGTVVPVSKDEPVVEFNYIGTGLRAGGLVLCAIILGLSIGFAAWTKYFEKQQVVRASQPIFLMIICAGTLLMGAAIIPMSFDDEKTNVEGLNVACQSIPFLFCMGFTLVFAALFSKMWRVNKLFNNPKMRRVKVTVMDVCKPLFALLFANILVLAIWTGLSPLIWVRKPISPVESVGQCTSDGALPYVVVLAVLDLGCMIFALYQAYHARKISLEFAESSYIAAAISFILLVCFIGIPSFLLTNSPQAQFFVMASIDFVICVSLLLFIFVPKEQFRRIKRGRSIRESVKVMAQARNLSFRAKRESALNTQASSITNYTGSQNVVSTISQSSDDGDGLRILDNPLKVKELQDKVDTLKKEIADLKTRNIELEALVDGTDAVQQEEVLNGEDAA